jgi:hypothetical protein
MIMRKLIENHDFKIGDWIILSEERIKLIVQYGFLEKPNPLAREVVSINIEERNAVGINLYEEVISVKKKDYRLATEKEIKMAKLKQAFIKNK